MEKACTKCKEVKSFDLFHKHKGKPHGLALWCKSCANENTRKHFQKKTPEEKLQAKRKYNSENRLRVNEYNRQIRRKYPEKHAARQALRRARKLQATPDWLTGAQKAQMNRTYKLRDIISDATGEQYHVDHLVPLNGENVCGLHVPWNLQVIPAKENLRKSNSFGG